MNLGVVHWGFPPRGGGVETHLLTILPEIARLGHNVFVLTETYPGEREVESFPGLTVFRRDELCVSKLQRVREIYALCRPLFEDFIVKNKIDVVQAHNLHMDYYDLSRSLVSVCHSKKIPCYIVLHNHEFIDRSEKVMVSILKELDWDKLVCISRFIERRFKEKIAGIPDDRWSVILHGIDLDRFKPIGPAEKDKMKHRYGFQTRKIILHPARILRWKGIIPAIKAMPEIVEKFPDVILVLTGRLKPIFKEEEEIKNYNSLVDQTIKDLHLEKAVYIGRYDISDLPHLTAVADTVVYTTIGEEPFGLCPVEAMACGIPVIVTCSGGLVESVVDGETGFVIERAEEKIPGELAEKIICILSNPLIAKKMGKAGRERAERHFDKKRMAQEMIKLSEELRKEF